MKFLNLFENDNYSDVPADVLGQLQGLVKREPNPAAQKKALQGHIDRYRSNQSKTKPQTALEKRKEDSKNLVASIEQRRQKVVGKEVQQPETGKPSGVLDLSGNKETPMKKPVDEPGPQYSGKPTLNDPIVGERGDDIVDGDKEEITMEKANEISNQTKSKYQQMYDQLMEVFDLEEEQASSLDQTVGKNRNLMKRLVENATKDGDKDPQKFKDAFARLIALGQTYEGRNRRGAGARSLNFEQTQQLLSNKDNLTREFGDGSPKQIKQMVENRLLVDTPMELVEEWMKSLSPQAKRIFGTGDAVKGVIPFLDDNDNEVKVDMSGEHFNGLNPRGQVKRGNKGVGRKKLMAKRLMDQLFLDPYTGLPLDLDRIELDHVRAIQDTEEGERFPRLSSFRDRENPDNWLWTDAAVNSIKNNNNMEFFLNNDVEPLRDKKKEDYVDLSNLQDAGTQHTSSIVEMIKNQLLDDDGYLSGSADQIQSVIDNEKELIQKLKDAGVSQKPRFAKEFFAKFRGGGRGKKIVRQQTGPKNQLTVPEYLYEPFIKGLDGKSPEEQEKIANDWNNTTLSVQKRIMKELLPMGGEDLKQQEDAMVDGDGNLNVQGTYARSVIRNLIRSGSLNSDVIQQNVTPRIFKNFQSLIRGMDDGLEEEVDLGMVVEQWAIDSLKVNLDKFTQLNYNN